MSYAAPSATALLLLLPLACGKPPAPAKWQASMTRWYQNSSVRPPEPPRQLWERDDEDLLLKRVGFADVVAVGTARVVTLFTMLGSPKRLALAFRPEEVIYGEVDQLKDEQGDLLLPFGPDDLDFQLGLRVFGHLAGTRYLLLLKRQPGEPVRLHWSLYRPDKKLVQEIRAMFRWLQKKKEED